MCINEEQLSLSVGKPEEEGHRHKGERALAPNGTTITATQHKTLHTGPAKGTSLLRRRAARQLTARSTWATRRPATLTGGVLSDRKLLKHHYKPNREDFF